MLTLPGKYLSHPKSWEDGFTGRLPHPLFSSKGRVEIRAIEVSSGRILAVARKTAAGVDLLERTSAVNALEKATVEVAAILIPEIMNRWSR